MKKIEVPKEKAQLPNQGKGKEGSQHAKRVWNKARPHRAVRSKGSTDKGDASPTPSNIGLGYVDKPAKMEWYNKKGYRKS